MDKDIRESIALARFQIISPILAEPKRAQNDYFREQAGKEHVFARYGTRRISVSTMKAWLGAYRAKGFNGLKPKTRNDSGRPRRLDEETIKTIGIKCKAYPYWSAQLLYEDLKCQGLLGEPCIHYNTLLRLVKQRGFLSTDSRGDVRKAFEHDNVNELWVCDFMHGPSVKSAGRSAKAIKLLDGNCIEKSQHRIKELRSIAAGPLPGKSLVVYDPHLRIPIDVFTCEDGHAQERSLLSIVLQTVMFKDVWVADRNFCTLDFTCEIDSKGAFFVIREHKNYPSRPVGEEIYIGETETGTVYEQSVSIVDRNDKKHIFRRCRLRLKKETRDGDRDICIISNLPQEAADATKIAELYRTRWTIETTFQELTEHLNSEINTLGYPRAAIFGFCVALVTYMILSVIKAALGNVHGTDTIKDKVSGYYLADEISGTYRGMMIAVPTNEWTLFARSQEARSSH